MEAVCWAPGDSAGHRHVASFLHRLHWELWEHRFTPAFLLSTTMLAEELR